MMKLVRKEEGKSRPGETFTGKAELVRKLTAQQPGGVALALVHFDDGALTHWHDHPGEQVLLILEGKGRVGNDDVEFEVEPGDIVYTSSGEKHWHGAVPGHSMTHLSITTEGPPNWHGPVD